MQIPERYYQLVSTGTKNSKIPTDISCRSYDNDKLYDYLSDLVNGQFKAWYCKMFYKIGRERVLMLAQIARADGDAPARLFSRLLKENYGQKS